MQAGWRAGVRIVDMAEADMTGLVDRARTRPDWVDAELFPFESRFVEIYGNGVHYIDEGSGPTLLFLHGNPTWAFVWRDVIRLLSGRFRCIAVDYPGFGLSAARAGYRYLPQEHADVVVGFLDALEIKGATLVGQDWGGLIGLACAQARPGAFDRLVLANTWAWPVNGIPHFEWFGRIVGGRPFGYLVRRFNVLVTWFLPAGHKRRKLGLAELDHYRRALGTPERRQASAMLPRSVLAERSFFAQVEAGLPEVENLPTLIVWGDADIAFRPQELHRLQRSFHNHKTVVLAGAGLYTESDAPDEFATAVLDWVDSGH